MSYDQLGDQFRDVAFTTTTPFSSDGEQVRHDKLRDNLRYLVDCGASVFVPCGNTGEYYALTDDERVAVVQTHAEVLGDDATILAGVGGSTKTATDLIRRYEEAGADAVMVMHPDHTYVHEQGLIKYYRRLAAATDLGVVVYKRGPELTRRVLTEVTEIENVVAVKYAVDDISAFSQTVANAPDGVVWLNGIAERYALSFAIEGAEGFSTGVGNFAPGVTLDLFAAIKRQDWERAHELRDRLRPYENLREGEGERNTIPVANNVPAVKCGMELAELYGGPVREPLSDLGEADRDRAEQYYRRISEVQTPKV